MPLAEIETIEKQLPPHDIDAERAVISSLMHCGEDTAHFAKIRRRLWKDAFFQPDHATIFSTLCQMVDAGRPVDPLLLAGELRNRGILEEIGGVQHLTTIITSHFTSLHGEHYAAIVADKARQREGMRIGVKLATKLGESLNGSDTRTTVQKAIEALWRVVNHGTPLEVKKLSAMVEAFMDAKLQDKAVHLETGIPLLDQFRGIFAFGKYTVIAGRPSMGKSTFVRWLLGELAAQGIPVGLIAVEEDGPKIAGNYLSSETGIANEKIAYAPWGEHEWKQVSDVAARMVGRPLWVTDAAHALDEIVTAFDVLSMQHGCRVIAIDHVHLVEHRAESREQQLNEISGTLKRLGKQRNVCTLAAAQLKRPSESVRYPPPPSLTDLRGSGAIEEHADAALFLHREDYYHRYDDDFQPDGLCRVLIPKNRNGCVGEATLKAELQYQRFVAPEIVDPFV